jgi:hypothetical protein
LPPAPPAFVFVRLLKIRAHVPVSINSGTGFAIIIAFDFVRTLATFSALFPGFLAFCPGFCDI